MREQWIPGALLPNYRAPGNEAMLDGIVWLVLFVMVHIPLLSNMQPTMPVMILRVRMGPPASLSWVQRTTPATVSLDIPDQTVAPTLMTVRIRVVLNL